MLYHETTKINELKQCQKKAIYVSHLHKSRVILRKQVTCFGTIRSFGPKQSPCANKYYGISNYMIELSNIVNYLGKQYRIHKPTHL